MNILNDYFNILIFQLSICLKFKISKAHHHGFFICICKINRIGEKIEGEDKTNQEPNKKHSIKPSAKLRTERKG